MNEESSMEDNAVELGGNLLSKQHVSFMPNMQCLYLQRKFIFCHNSYTIGKL
jgi:hypothetical protein